MTNALMFTLWPWKKEAVNENTRSGLSFCVSPAEQQSEVSVVAMLTLDAGFGTKNGLNRIFSPNPQRATGRAVRTG